MHLNITECLILEGKIRLGQQNGGSYGDVSHGQPSTSASSGTFYTVCYRWYFVSYHSTLRHMQTSKVTLECCT